MKRRDFFKISAPVGASSLLLNGFSVSPFASRKMLSNLACEGVSDRVLVIIRLNGGNDGINNIIPIDQHDFYMSKRPNIGISMNDLVELDSNLALPDQIGLHPSLTEFKDIYEASNMNVNIVQGVSYNQPNYSHFKATDLLLTGGDGTINNSSFDTGWMGRYLNYSFPGSAGSPTSTMPDPLGIQVGDRAPSLGFHTAEQHETEINLGWNDPSGYYDLVSQIGGAPPTNIPAGEYGQEMQYIMDIENSVASYAQRIQDVFNSGNNANNNYPGTGLAYQLRTVARLISGGSKTKIFLVNLGGFDNHNDQIEAANNLIGTHAERLQELSQAVKAFMDDLAAQTYLDGTLLDKVLTVSFSEFGRRPFENDNNGTDHGNLFPMYVFGSGAKNGITGTNINLSNVDDPNDLNPYLVDPTQHDYRQVYTTILQDWLGASDGAVNSAYFSDYLDQKIDIIDPGFSVSNDCRVDNFLPVHIVSFNAIPTEDLQVKLTWETAFEKDNSYFEIQRSSDGINFERLDRIVSQGDSAFTKQYQEMDANPLPGTSYYRLKQVDLDGATKLTDIKSVTFDSNSVRNLKVYPVPARFDVKVVMTLERPSADINLEIFDLGGKMHQTEIVRGEEGFNKRTLDISNLAEGNYLLRVSSLNLNFAETRKLIVKRY